MNKCVLITGATRGIGRATAIKFAKSGYDVIINYLNNDDLAEKLKEELISKYSANITLIKANVKIEQDVIKLKNEVYKKYKKIDVLVNNAGVISDKEFRDRTIDDFNAIIGTNLASVFLMSKYFGFEMYKEHTGKIINISSTNGINSYTPTTIDYDAAKAGVISMTKNLAVEFSPYVNVNSVAPGWVDTDMNKCFSEEERIELADEIPAGRFAKPNEIADLAYCIATGHNYLTAQVISLDGGFL